LSPIVAAAAFQQFILGFAGREQIESFQVCLQICRHGSISNREVRKGFANYSKEKFDHINQQYFPKLATGSRLRPEKY
jgi:hypothetical protein